MIDLKVHNTLPPKKGRVLITEPFADDDYFGRSIILLCEHNEDGTFGFVLNKFIDLDLEEAVQISGFDTKISIGGPVSNKNLYFIHTLGDEIEDSTHIVENIYSGGNFEALKTKIELGLVKKNEVRFFIGYSGWVVNQLEGELKQNAWLVADILNSEEIMDVENKTLWIDFMKRQGGKYKAFSNFPEDPNLN